MLLIAGSNGHVGREIVRKCIARNIRTRCFDIRPLDIADVDTSPVEVMTGDITKLDSVKDALKGVDVVMDVIGMRGESKELSHEMVEYGGMQNLIKAGSQSGVRHIMYTSALGVAQESPARTLSAKWKTEQALIKSGITYTIFRPSGYFADFAEYFAPQIKKTGKFTIIGDGSVKLQPLNPADLAEAFMQSVDSEKAKNKVFKISGPEVFTLEELVRLVGKVVEKDVTIRKVPFWLANVLFSVLSVVTGKRGTKDFLYRMSRDSICTDQEIQQVKEAFNIEFTKLEPWLREKVRA